MAAASLVSTACAAGSARLGSGHLTATARHRGAEEIRRPGARAFVDGGECAINPHRDICAKEISLVGSWVYNSFEYPNAYHFLQRAERIGLPVSSLVTHKFPLDQIDEAFQTNLRQEGIKVVVEAW